MTEVFEYLCPTYMAYGMTWDQYWYGDPWMTKIYADYFLLQRKLKNEELWLQGLYFYRAVYAVIASAFGRKPEKYMSTPLDFLPKTKAERDQELYEKRKKLINYLDSFVRKGTDQSNKGVDENGKP